MRRANKEITDAEDIIDVLRRCKVCRLGMALGDEPYVAPLNFGCTWSEGVLTLYFHGAEEGRKVETLRRNPRACFEVDIEGGLTGGAGAGGCSFAYESVIGFGRVTFIEGDGAKSAAMDAIMRHQTGQSGPFTYDTAHLARTAIYRLDVESFTGKRRRQAQPGRKPGA